MPSWNRRPANHSTSCPRATSRAAIGSGLRLCAGTGTVATRKRDTSVRLPGSPCRQAFLVVRAAAFLVVAFFAVVFFAAVFLVVVFLTALRAVFLTGPRARLSASSS